MGGVCSPPVFSGGRAGFQLVSLGLGEVGEQWWVVGLVAPMGPGGFAEEQALSSA